jgi:SDR family mycofactocin-dependent oxidoreductase
MGRVEGKVALVTGAGRGQGRSHAVRLAEEGADIIAVDRCRDFETAGYPMATSEELAETAKLVEKTGRRALTYQVDVADAPKLQEAIEAGVAELGHLEIVVTAAGIAAIFGQPALQGWCDTINTNLIGTINAIQLSLTHLGDGASIVATGSMAALAGMSSKGNPGDDSSRLAYRCSKRLLSQYVHDLATELTVRGIRVNVVHPTNVNTPMLQNDPMYRMFRPDLEHPTREDAEPAFYVQQAMKVPWVESHDISSAVLWLASDEARYVTGMQLRVDAGLYLKAHDYHI